MDTQTTAVLQRLVAKPEAMTLIFALIQSGEYINTAGDRSEEEFSDVLEQACLDAAALYRHYVRSQDEVS